MQVARRPLTFICPKGKTYGYLFLTCHRVWPRHQVERDGLHGLGQDALQVPLRDLVEAVGRRRHVLVHAVQTRVHAGLLRLPRLQVSSRSKVFAALPSVFGAFHVF